MPEQNEETKLAAAAFRRLKKDGKVAESVFIAGLFVLSGREFADIAKHRGLPNEASSYLAEVAKMEATILKHGWDGDWFLAGTTPDPRRSDSAECGGVR